jgi:transposase
MVARRSAAGERTQTNGQARALVLTGPDDLRVRFAGHTAAALVAVLASLRPRPGSTVGYATRIALRELGRRAQFPGTQLGRLDELIVPLVTARAPGLLALYGIGPHTAALLLIAAGDHPQRLRSEAAWAHLCAAAPIPASSGKTVRHRLNPGGDRQASHALWRIVFTRLGSDPATRAYVERRTAEGKSKAEIIRCLKRYVARQVYPHLRTPAG